jgi:hypothetical protein
MPKEETLEEEEEVGADSDHDGIPDALASDEAATAAPPSVTTLEPDPDLIGTPFPLEELETLTTTTTSTTTTSTTTDFPDRPHPQNTSEWPTPSETRPPETATTIPTTAAPSGAPTTTFTATTTTTTTTKTLATPDNLMKAFTPGTYKTLQEVGVLPTSKFQAPTNFLRILPEGKFVHCLKVVFVEEEGTIRCHLAAGGWISILDTKTGHPWAMPWIDGSRTS